MSLAKHSVPARRIDFGPVRLEPGQQDRRLRRARAVAGRSRASSAPTRRSRSAASAAARVSSDWMPSKRLPGLVQQVQPVAMPRQSDRQQFGPASTCALPRQPEMAARALAQSSAGGRSTIPGAGFRVVPSTPCRAIWRPSRSNSTALTTVLPMSMPRIRSGATAVDLPGRSAVGPVVNDGHQAATTAFGLAC